MYGLDCRFEDSREHAFLVDMMQCVVHGDLDKFAASLNEFNSLSKFDDILLEAWESIKNAVAEQSKKQKNKK